MFLAWQYYNIFYAVTLGHLLHSTQNGAFMLMLGMSTIIFIIRHGNRVQCTIIQSQMVAWHTFPQNFSTNLESKSSALFHFPPSSCVNYCLLYLLLSEADHQIFPPIWPTGELWSTLLNLLDPLPFTLITQIKLGKYPNIKFGWNCCSFSIVGCD